MCICIGQMCLVLFNSRLLSNIEIVQLHAMLKCGHNRQFVHIFHSFCFFPCQFHFLFIDFQRNEHIQWFFFCELVVLTQKMDHHQSRHPLNHQTFSILKFYSNFFLSHQIILFCVTLTQFGERMKREKTHSDYVLKCKMEFKQLLSTFTTMKTEVAASFFFNLSQIDG